MTNFMRRWFIELVLFWMYKDLQITKECIRNAKVTLAGDELRIRELEMELWGLRSEK